MHLIVTTDNLLFEGIVLQTRQGNNVINTQGDPLSLFEEHKLKEINQRYPLARQIRTDALPHYNCHGLVFASRRTCVHEPTEVYKIIAEDGYTEVSETEVKPGDVALYISRDNDLEHSGIVIEKHESTPALSLILSKWGRGSEIIHGVHYCPYPDCTLKYYRMKQ